MVNMQISSSFELKNLKRGVSRAALVSALFIVAGCSTPDWADPTEWFDGDSSDASRPTKIEQPEEAEGDYPQLGSVPDEAGKTISIEEANDIQEGLKADKENAQYTDEKLRADTAVKPLPVTKKSVVQPPSVPQAAPTGPAVTAAPTAAVSAAPIPQPVQVPTVAAIAQPVVPPVPTNSSGTAAPGTAGQFPQTSNVTGLKQIPNASPVTTPQQAYARLAPGTGTMVISGTGVQDVFQKQLAVSAATTTTLPANTQFQSYPIQSLGPSAVTVPQIVRDTYNTPVVAGYGAAVGARVPRSGGYAAPGATAGQPDAVIFFETGSARVGATDRRKLQLIANTLKQTGGIIRVVGHASSRTRELPVDRHMMVNLRMSQERSSAVVASLIQLGVSSTQIVVESVSDSAPLVREAMPSDEAKNRRTEIFLVK